VLLIKTSAFSWNNNCVIINMHGKTTLKKNTFPYVASTGLEGKGRSAKTHTQDCRSSSSEVCPLRVDEPVSEAVNSETALCEERKVWVSKWRKRDRYGFKYVVSAVAVCCACSRESGGLTAKQRLFVCFVATDESDSDQLCFSVGTRGLHNTPLLLRSVYSTNILADFGAC
jgi:hypothetical protein